MPEYEYRRTGEDDRSVPIYEGQGGQGGGAQNAQGSSGGSSGGGSGGGSQGGGQNPQRRNSQGRFTEHSEGQDGQSSRPQSGKESQMTHQTPPIVVAGAPVGFGSYGFPGFGFPGYGYGYPGVPAGGSPQTTVVTGADGHDDKHDALLGITVDNIRESSSVGRTNQLSQQIEGLGDRADARASFDRDMHLFSEFSTLQKGQHDVENRLLTAIKDNTIAVLDKMNEQRIRDLESRLANVQEARRDDRSEALLRQILAKMS